MYLKRIVLTNIKSFEKLVWDPELPDDKLAGWHVIIGDNGAGKTSFMRAVALALIGPMEATALNEVWGDWVQHGKEEARIDLKLTCDLQYDQPKSTPLAKESLPVRLSITRLLGAKDFDLVRTWHLRNSKKIDASQHVWGGHSGWFSAAYGPFRRLTGGDEIYRSSFSTKLRLARHLSIFSERISLTESVQWLKDLHHKELLSVA